MTKRAHPHNQYFRNVCSVLVNIPSSYLRTTNISDDVIRMKNSKRQVIESEVEREIRERISAPLPNLV
jgi:predicted HAD superfamily phosphohydrolase